MALLKERVNSTNGAITNYHKIGSINLRQGILLCEIESYTSKEYRNKGARLENSYNSFNITLEEEESMGIRQLAYAKLKTLPEWEGAEDC